MGLEPSDILFIAIVIWLAIEIINGDWGGGRRARAFPRSPDLVLTTRSLILQ